MLVAARDGNEGFAKGFVFPLASSLSSKGPEAAP